MKVKVLIAHNPYQQAGGEDVVFKQEVQMLRDEGHEVVTYIRSNQEINQYVGLGKFALAARTIWSSQAKREFAALLAKEKPDIVQVHNTFVMISPSIFSACREARVPVVHTLHNFRLFCPTGMFYRDNRICEECVEHSLWAGIRHGCYHDSRATTAVVAGMIAAHRWLGTWREPDHFYIALSQFARQKFVDSGLDPSQIFVKPNFVSPDPGMPAEKGLYAVFAGRLSPEKRVSTLLNAWELGKSRVPLLILGGGPQHFELEEVAKERGLSGVRFLGHLPREKVIATIRGARFLVFTSEWYENFPMTIAEAFASGTPVLCSRLGAMAEIVSDGTTGLHFRAGDVEDLADKMDWAWNHPEEMSAMGRAARSEYEQKYTAAANYRLLTGIYQSVLDKCGVRPELKQII